MKVKFLENYIGRETAMQFANAGDILEIPTAQALELLRLGVVDEVTITTTETPAMADTLPRFIEGGLKSRRKKAGGE